MHTHTDTHVWREGKRSQRHGQWSDKSCRHTHVEGREETDHSDTGNGVTNRTDTHVWREGKRQITVTRAKE